MAEASTVVQGAEFVGMPVSVFSAFIGGLVSGALVFAAAWITQRGEGSRLATRLREERDAEREAHEKVLRRSAYVEALKY